MNNMSDYSDKEFKGMEPASVPQGMRRASHYGNSMPGGRMKWWKLKEGKCPRCSYLLETEDESRFIRCENPHCSFGITATRLKQIVDGMDEPDRSEEAN